MFFHSTVLFYLPSVKEVLELPNADYDLNESFAHGWTLALLPITELNQTMGLFSFLYNLITYLLLQTNLNCSSKGCISFCEINHEFRTVFGRTR